MLDTHCHLNDNQFIGEVDQIVNNFLQAGVKKAICIGCDPQTNKKAKEIANNYEHVYFTIGIHPDDCDKYNEKEIEHIYKDARKIYNKYLDLCEHFHKNY